MLKPGAALALVVLFVLAGYGVWVSSHDPPYHQTVTRSYQNATKQIRPEPPEERIADYTEVLAWFTGLLALVSAVQIYFLTKADKTAQTAAEAAKQSVDATLALERPYLFAAEETLVRPNGPNDPSPHIAWPLARLMDTLSRIGLWTGRNDLQFGVW